MKKSFHEYHGGFSDEIYYSYRFQEYINSGLVAGYIGSSERSITRDRIIEKALREQGLEKEGIATWLTSTSARHLMDNVEDETSDRKFWKLVREYTKDAFIQVTIWSHPDHHGNLKSTIELTKKIRDIFEGYNR